jgi:hypothetical protein
VTSTKLSMARHSTRRQGSEDDEYRERKKIHQ